MAEANATGSQESPEERQRRIEEAKKKAAEGKAARAAATSAAPPPTPPTSPAAPPQAAAATSAKPATPAPMSEDERQRRIEEAKKLAEEARKARESAQASGQAAVPAAPRPAVPAPAPATAPRPAPATAAKPGAIAASQAPPRVIPVALKEWAVVVKALEQGKQLILLRKGGLQEREFKIMKGEFVLFPTYEHQDEKMLKPAFKPLLQEVGTAPADPNKVTVTSWARLHEAIPVRNLDKLVQMEDYHIFSRPYAEERHNYKVYLPTNVLFVRTYILPQPISVNLTPEQAGCTSWVDIEVKIPWEGSRPALSDDEFRRRHQEARTIIT